jgi:nucleoid DNA-binding protein
MDKKVNLQEFTQRIADRIEVSGTDAERFIQSLFEIVEENLLTDKIVRIKGIGTFKLLEVNARTSVDVNTKERIEIKEHFRVTFTPDAVLKDKVNKPFGGFTSVVLDECNVDTGVLENTEDDPLTDDQLTAYESATTPTTPELNIHVDIPTETTMESERQQLHEHVQEPKEEPVQVSCEPAKEPTESEEKPCNPTKETSEPIEELSEPAESSCEPAEEPSESPEKSSESSETASEAAETLSEPEQVSEESQQEDNSETESFISEEEGDETRGTTPVTPIKSEKTETITPLNPKNMRQNEGNSGSGHSFTRIILSILVVLLLAACGMLGYCAYKLYYNPEQTVADSSIVAPTAPSLTATPKDTLQTADEEPEDSLSESDEVGDGTIDINMRAEIMKQELSSYYPQMEGAEYLIIGTADTVQVKPGISLTKLAKTYFGNGDFVSYIKFYNRIDNPDLLREGQKLLIPLLTKK